MATTDSAPGPSSGDDGAATEITGSDQAVWAAAALASFTKTAIAADERLPLLSYAGLVQHLVTALCHAVSDQDNPADVLARGFRVFSKQYDDEAPGDLEFSIAEPGGQLIAAVLRLADDDPSSTPMHTLLHGHLAYHEMHSDY